MKRIAFTLFFVIVYLASVVAANRFESMGLYYEVNYDGSTVSVTWQSQSSKSNYANYQVVTIPEKVTYSGKTYTVTAIGESAFKCSGVTTIKLANSVTSIEDLAFYQCASLENVDFGESVIEIGTAAFGYCSGLKSIVIPKSVTKLDNNVFMQCTQLTSISVESGNPVYDSRGNCNAIVETASNVLVTGCLYTQVPNTVEAIGFQAFSGSLISEISLPNSVTTIYNFAFAMCSKLTNVNLDNSVKVIGAGAFEQCYELASINLPPDIQFIGERTFYKCIRLTSVKIPDKVTFIRPEAFSGCYRLLDITLPKSLKEIDASALRGCSRLKSIVIPESVEMIERNAFSDCTQLAKVEWNANADANIVNGDQSPFSGDTNLSSFVFGDNVKKIPSFLCYQLTGLETVTLGKSITTIGEHTFRECTSLKSVTLPESVDSIGYYAFYGCTALKEVSLNDKLRRLSSCVFSGCSSLTSISVPHSVTSIDYGAFSWCKSLQTITIGKGVNAIGTEAFNGCAVLSKIYSYPDAAAVTMGYRVFQDVPQNVCELHVLPQYLSSYQTTAQWINFLNKIGDLTDEGEPTTPTRFTVVPMMAELNPDKTLQLSVENTDDNNITWESSDESIASVSPQGKVTAHKSGMVAIWATTSSGQSTFCAIFCRRKGDLNSDDSVDSSDTSIMLDIVLGGE